MATSSRLLLRSAAVAAAGAALGADVGLNEHPTHTVVLGVVAVVVWALHRRLMRDTLALTALPAVSAGLAAQPVLHLASKIGQPPVGAHDHGSLLHIFASEAPVAGMQVVVPVVALVALASVAHLLYALLDVCAAHWHWIPHPRRHQPGTPARSGSDASAPCCTGAAGRFAPPVGGRRSSPGTSYPELL